MWYMVYSLFSYSVLAWMSAMVSLNELRAGPRFKKGIEAAEGTCSDGRPLSPSFSLSLSNLQ
jgi:hypothetical protein